jgi:replicative DNA helicase
MPNKYQNQDAERNLLGAILIDKKTLPKIAGKIKIGDFYRDTHNVIFEAMLDLPEVDIITLSDKLEQDKNLEKIGGTSYLTNLINLLPSSSQAEHYADIVSNYAMKRWLNTLLESKKEELDNKPVKEFITELSLSLINKTQGIDEEDPSIKTAIKEYEIYQEKNREAFLSGKRYLGLESGFKFLDEAISGIQASHVWLFNAYTGTGKSFLALNIANSVLLQGKKVVFFSLEMGKNAMVGRLMGLGSGINSMRSATGAYIESELEAKATLYESQLSVYRNKRELKDILFTMMKEHAQKPVDLFVVDYIQHIKVKGAKGRYETYTDASNDLQDMAVRLNVPIVELSQIDNFSARSKDTKFISSKGSGDISGDAQLIVLLQDDEERQQSYKDKIRAINFIIQKNTYGEFTGKKEMIFDKRDGRFHEAEDYAKITNNLQ